MSRHTVPFILFAVLTVMGGVAQAQSVPLEWKWDEGDRTQYRLTEHMHQSISGPFQTELAWTRRMEFRDRVLAVDGDAATVERTFEWVEISVEYGGGRPVRHDTRFPDSNAGVGQNEPSEDAAVRRMLIEPFAALAGASIVFTVDGEGEVGEVRGSAEAIDAMLGPLDTSKLMATIRGFQDRPDREQQLARQLEQALAVIPGRMVRRGERWPIEIDHVTPLRGQLTSDLTATFERWNRRDKTASIALDGKLVQGEDKEPNHFPDLLTITLDSGKITGSISFDTERGQVAQSVMEIHTVFSVLGRLVGEGETQLQTLTQTATLERLGAPGSRRRP